jgi:hypothetical protein
MTATSWTPKLTNVVGVDGTSGTGKYVSANGVCTFTAQIAAQKEDCVGVQRRVRFDPAGTGRGRRPVRLPGRLDGRDADNGVWTGEAQIYAGSDGTQIDRIRVTSGSNGAAVLNVEHLYGDSEGAMAAEIFAVTGSYPTA